MELRKSHWAADGNRLSLAMPISKVDEEKRLVSGFATLDNIDTSDDVVLASASSAAFARFRGNIREMHEPIAAGRLVDFKEDEFYHNGEFYRGVYVTAYVSKGAQNTWEKVLDGTLSGFSIGGNIVDAETEFVKDANKVVRFIKDYDLVELSLVDNPANQLANVFSIQKNSEGSFIKGMVAETHLINVFWCSEDEVAKNSTEEVEDCSLCGSTMEQIGWFERGEDAASKMQALVTKYLRQGEDEIITKTIESGEGGVEMADNTNDAPVEAEAAEDVVTTETVADVEEAPAEEGAGDVVTSDDVAADEQPSEVEAEPNFEKMFDDLKGSVNETLEQNKESIEKAVETVEAKVSEVTTAFDEKISEFEKSLGEFSERLDSIKTEREDVSKRIDALEKATAIKKSGEVETPSGEGLQKGLWSGTFFNG